MKKPELYNESYEATFCPEDNKLRLYVGRVPRDEYEALRAEGWTSTPKQSCQFVAVWTPQREDTALSYAGEIGDEDQGPADRAADRADRFAGYREARRNEAGAMADRFDILPQVHGYQDAGRAERAAARHATLGRNACNLWEKAEYWQSRTAGVISHALHLSRPSVRMGRIKEIEAEMRKRDKELAEYNRLRGIWQRALEKGAEALTEKLCDHFGGYGINYIHPRTGRAGSLYGLYSGEGSLTLSEAAGLYLAEHPELTGQGRVYRHCELRLAYEKQMLAAVGGMAGEEEIQIGGKFCGRVVYKVNKSSVTGRVTTIEVLVNAPKYRSIECACVQGWYFHSIDMERNTGGNYEPPTPEGIALAAGIKKELADKKKAGRVIIPLINPTPESAAVLQGIINSTRGQWGEGAVVEITQARYSANSSGSYACCEARAFKSDGSRPWRQYHGYTEEGAAFKCRIQHRGAEGPSVIVLTDKPQKPLPIVAATVPMTEVTA